MSGPEVGAATASPKDHPINSKIFSTRMRDACPPIASLVGAIVLALGIYLVVGTAASRALSFSLTAGGPILLTASVCTCLVKRCQDGKVIDSSNASDKPQQPGYTSTIEKDTPNDQPNNISQENKKNEPSQKSSKSHPVSYKLPNSSLGPNLPPSHNNQSLISDNPAKAAHQDPQTAYSVPVALNKWLARGISSKFRILKKAPATQSLAFKRYSDLSNAPILLDVQWDNVNIQKLNTYLKNNDYYSLEDLSLDALSIHSTCNLHYQYHTSTNEIVEIKASSVLQAYQMHKFCEQSFQEQIDKKIKTDPSLERKSIKNIFDEIKKAKTAEEASKIAHCYKVKYELSLDRSRRNYFMKMAIWSKMVNKDGSYTDIGQTLYILNKRRPFISLFDSYWGVAVDNRTNLVPAPKEGELRIYGENKLTAIYAELRDAMHAGQI